MAMRKAANTKVASRVIAGAQPMQRREKASSTTAK
jgi:hypothetical protein